MGILLLKNILKSLPLLRPFPTTPTTCTVIAVAACAALQMTAATPTPAMIPW